MQRSQMNISDEVMEQMREHYAKTVKDCCLDMSNPIVRNKIIPIYRDGLFYITYGENRIGEIIRLKGIDKNGQKIITHQKPILWRKQNQHLLKK